ncbi:MAG: type IV pilus assembly protein PilV [Flavobacteriales bacterium]|jgi:type IV pilus assembly protein PilV
MRKQNGSSLIEVMVALFVLAIGILGVLGAQTRSMRMSQDAHLYSQATMLVNDLYESMKSHTDSTTFARYIVHAADTDLSEPSCRALNSRCDNNSIAQWNVWKWKDNITEFLPGGEGKVEVVDGTIVAITVSFQATSLELAQTVNDSGESSDVKSQVVLTTVF